MSTAAMSTAVARTAVMKTAVMKTAAMNTAVRSVLIPSSGFSLFASRIINLVFAAITRRNQKCQL